MNKLIGSMLALAIAALAPVANAQTTPSAYKSLQPFERFAKGAGEGVAYSYKERTKTQFVALLRDKQLAKKEMRVDCNVLVRQMVEGHRALPFEGCEGAAAAIESNNDFAVVSCRDEMFQKENFLVVTNEEGTAFGSWHRKCYQDEQVLVYKNQPLISLKCLNVAIPTTPQKAPPSEPQAPVFTSGTCPQGYTLFAYAFSLSSPAMPNDLREAIKKQIAAANERDSGEGQNQRAYQTEAVSRTYGARLLNEVPLAPVTVDGAIRYVDSGSGSEKLRFADVGVLKMVGGRGVFKFAEDPRTHESTSTVWPADSELISPTLSGPDDNLGREIRIFRYEWAKCKLFQALIKP